MDTIALNHSAATSNLAEDMPAENRETLWSLFGEMTREIVATRELLLQMTARDIRLRYKQAIMGFGWALLMPMMLISAGLLVKSAMAHVAGTSVETSGMAAMAIKSLAWTFFVGSTSFATVCLTTNTCLISKTFFPREVFPLSTVLTQIVDSSVGSFLVGIFVFFSISGPITLAVLWAVPVLFLLIAFTTATSMLFACTNLFFRDVKYIVQIILNFGIFFTPVFFEPQLLGPVGGTLMMLNPLTPLFEGLRLAIIEQHSLLQPLVVTMANGTEFLAWSPWYLAYAAMWSLGGLAGSWLLFHKLEYLYAEYI